MRKRVLSLEAIRVFMTITIVFSHFGFLKNYSYGDVYDQYLNNATLGVDYFFVLSGYGMMKNYQGAISTNIVSSIKFGLSKIKKIYFAYVLSLLVFLPYCLYFSINENGLLLAILKTGVKYIACLMLIQSMSGTIAYAHAINGVCWFLSSIFIIYIMCPKLMKLITVYKNIYTIRVMCFINIFICAFTKLFFLCIGTKFGLDDLSYSFPFARLPYVTFGMCLCRLLDMNQAKKKTLNNMYADIISATLAIIWFFIRNSCSISSFWLVCIDLLVCGILLYNYAQEKSIFSQKLASSVLAKLGGSMMYVYLFHYPVLIYVDLFFKGHRYIVGEITGIVEVIIVSSLTMLIANCIRKLNKKITSIA